MSGTYDYFLVALSIVVSVLAGYATLELSARMRAATKPYRVLWLAAGAVATGTGIWSMHFIGMLAFELPIPLAYDIPLTLLSWAVPIVTAACALGVVQRRHVTIQQWALASVLLGLAIAGMHYIGMAALNMSPAISYLPSRVGLSLVFSIGLSGLGLWAMRNVPQSNRRGVTYQKGAVAVLLGAAISAMHYTGMWAADFPLGALCLTTGGVGREGLPFVVGGGAILLLLGVSSIAHLDRRRIEHKNLAETDALTGMKNRHYLQTRLPVLIEKAQAARLAFHLAFIDLDGFKLVNDTLGHEAGDAVLVLAARRVSDCLRYEDLVARVGGDEFVVVLIGADEARVESVIQRIIVAIQEPMSIGNETVRVSASVGIARHFIGQDPDSLLVRADTAMYHAKREGKSTWKRFVPSMDTERLQTAETHRCLQQAFERSEFRLFYQPKYAAGSREIVGVEALIRWNDPQKGIRLPGDFINVAERTGLIAALGDWVLNEACRQIREWNMRGWVIPVSINVSALQVRGHEITGKVVEALAKHQVNAESLMLEITESMAIADPEQAMQVFNALRHCGVSISIDDFGTGYSSLAYLRDFPAAEIKIDKAFVRDISRNRQALELVRAIVSMGHALGMLVVAEGVEDEHTTALLESLNCDVLQGYHLGRPMEATDLSSLLARTL